MTRTEKTAVVEIKYIKADVEGWTVSIRQHLSFLPKKAMNKVVRSVSKPQSNLLPFLAEHIFNDKNQTYLPLSDRVEVPGYNHQQTEQLVAEDISITEVGSHGIQYFANPLSIPSKDDTGRYFPPPSERIINCGVYVHTFEIDPIENFQEGLAEQISWCIGGRKDVDCLIGQIYQALCQFKDFRGAEYIWSGNKSCHLHVAFDVRHLSSQKFKPSRKSGIDNDLPDLPDHFLRDGYMNAWDEIASILQAHNIMAEADISLRRSEQWRRLSWGIRRHLKESAIGIPAGTIVPQLVLWSKFRNDGRGHSDCLHQPRKFLKAKRQAKKKTHKPVPACDFTEDQQTRFIKELGLLCGRLWGDPKDNPRPASVGSSANDHIIQFYNHEQDKTPSSFIRGNHNRLVVQGTIRNKDNHFVLPKTANELVEYFLINGHLFLQIEDEEVSPLIEKMFQDKVKSAQDARDKLGAYAVQASMSSVALNSCIFAGEGATKSTGFMKSFPGQDVPHEGHIIFACQSYEQAEQKCREFNDLNQDDAYQGIFLQSLSACVSQACEALDIDKLTSESIAASGHSNMLDGIYSLGGKLVEWLETSKAALWDELYIDEQKKKRPVWFTVHSVAQNWHLFGGTRLWLHHAYAAERVNPEANMKSLYNQMSAQWIIYDEVRMDDLRVRYPANEVEWVQQIDPEFNALPPRQKVQSYQMAANVAAPPDMSFDKARKIANNNFCEDDIVTVDTNLEPFGNNKGKSPYLKISGNRHYAKARDWWHENPARITFLTTEHRIITAMKNMENGPIVFNFDQPELFSDEEISLDLILDKQARKKNIGGLIQHISKKYPNGKIISNMAEGGATSHDTAKGSNSFNHVGTGTVSSIYTMLSPGQYEELLVENAVFDTKNMVQLFYLDQFNQSVGRTLGFRYNPDIRTQAYISPRLWKEIGISIEMNSRYRVRLVEQSGDVTVAA